MRVPDQGAVGIDIEFPALLPAIGQVVADIGVKERLPQPGEMDMGGLVDDGV
jgi:hypothetical protein